MLRTALRGLLQEKCFWQQKCRVVLEEKQSLEDKTKVGGQVSKTSEYF